MGTLAVDIVFPFRSTRTPFSWPSLLFARSVPATPILVFSVVREAATLEKMVPNEVFRGDRTPEKNLIFVTSAHPEKRRLY
jgi:hypothetical protein